MCNNCNQNNCTDCTQEVHICNQCPTTEPCDCAVKDLATDCIVFTNDDIECDSVVVIAKNTILSDALANIVSWSCTKFSNIEKFFRIINTGIGAEIFSGINLLGEKKLRKIKSASSIITVTQNTDDISLGIDSISLDSFIETNQKTYTILNLGTGTEVYNNSTIVGNNTQFNLKTLKSNTLNITTTEDEISINSISLESESLKTFYVNSNYTPTIDSPSDGSIIRPYITYDEARTAFIGIGDIVDPEFSGATIVLQTSSDTNQNPTVNQLIIKLENNSRLTYTGTDLYMLDTEILYPLIAKNSPRQDLSKEINIKITGYGSLNRNNGIGLVRGMGANRNGLGIPTDNLCQISIGMTDTDNIALTERIEYPESIWDGDITNSSNIPLENFYGYPHKYSLQLPPTIPLLYTKYPSGNPLYFGLQTKGLVTISTLANTAIKIDGTDILLTGDEIRFYTYGDRISTTSSTKIVDFPSHYAPHTDKNFVEGKGLLNCKKISMQDKDGYSTTGVDKFFKFMNNSTFTRGNIDITTNSYVNKFIDMSDITNTIDYFKITNTLEGSNIDISAGRYFIDTTETDFNLTMPNSVIKIFLNKSLTTVNIIPITEGTVSSFFGNPVISGVNNYTDDTAASLAGLVTNGLYYNTTTGGLKTVS